MISEETRSLPINESTNPVMRSAVVLLAPPNDYPFANLLTCPDNLSLILRTNVDRAIL